MQPGDLYISIINGTVVRVKSRNGLNTFSGTIVLLGRQDDFHEREGEPGHFESDWDIVCFRKMEPEEIKKIQLAVDISGLGF